MLAAATSVSWPADGVLAKRKSLAVRPAMPVMLKVIVSPAENLELLSPDTPKLTMISYFPSQSGLKAFAPVKTLGLAKAPLDSIWANTRLEGLRDGFRLKYHWPTNSLPVRPGADNCSWTVFAPASLNVAVNQGV